jgi:hypothetical protein
MSALLKFQCRPSVRGYRVLKFDARRFCHFDEVRGACVWDARSSSLGSDDDEKELLERWDIEVFAASLQGKAPGITEYLVPTGPETRSFDLFDTDPSAYLKFANTPLTADAVREFADEFGMLFGPTNRHGVIRLGRGGVLQEGELETIASWFDAIRALQDALSTWQKAEDTGDFTKLLRLMTRTEHGITDHAVAVSLAVGEGAAVPRLSLSPKNLFEALMLQLALAIDGSQSLQTCVECKGWFTIQAGRGRSDKRYCSDACRMRAYRRRKSTQERLTH